MDCVECVVTPYNRYTDLSFVESGVFDGVKLVCACIMLPRCEIDINGDETVYKVKTTFETWFQESIRVGSLYKGRLELEKEQARIYHKLQNLTVDTLYRICVFLNIGDLFIYNGSGIEAVRVTIQDMEVFTSDQSTVKQEITGLARKSKGSIAALGNLLERRCVSSWTNASESTFFVICKGR